jgi:hypothetical protein
MCGVDLIKTYKTGTIEQLNTKDRKANLQYMSIYSVMYRVSDCCFTPTQQFCSYQQVQVFKTSSSGLDLIEI